MTKPQKPTPTTDPPSLKDAAADAAPKIDVPTGPLAMPAAGELRAEMLEQRILLSGSWYEPDGDPSGGASGGNDVYGGDDTGDLANALAGDDTLFGGLGDDTLTGGDNSDKLFGDSVFRKLVTKTNTFDDANNGWTGFQNENSTLAHDYGWQSTNIAGGASSGEAGGEFARAGEANWYADRDIGTLTLADDLSFQTRLTVDSMSNPDQEISLGWSDGRHNQLGIEIRESSPGYRMYVVAEDGSTTSQSSVINLSQDVDYLLDFQYSATTEVATLEVRNASTNAVVATRTLDVSTSAVTGETFDRFGLQSDVLSSGGVTSVIDLRIDDISYTSATESDLTTGGADSLTGSSGSDELYGEGGADKLDGGLGQDYLVGDAPEIAQILLDHPDLTYSVETGKFYKVVTIRTDWNDARDIASTEQVAGMSGRLALPGSAAENAFLRTIADGAGLSDFHVDATDNSTGGA
ncbi:MAG: hypothetical protein AAF743_16270, partial [Planctomycetota bacterium]